MLIDTHVHLNVQAFDEDRHEVIQRARENGISHMINVGFNRETIPSSIALAEQYDFIYSTVGWHPTDAKDMTPDDLEWIESLCRHEKVVAIGEIGLDYYWDTSPKDVQARVFREQIRLARKLGMPIVIHNRDAHHDVVQILREEKAAEVGGVMHCYSGSWETAKMCLDMNFYISFGGPVTFKNAKQPKEVLEKVPLDRLLIETDAPYLAPHPYRGKRNESSYVRLVAETAAQIKGISLEELAGITSRNAISIFGIK
ncbi:MULTISPECIES: TatD family hydrolase [Paenibacillus]|uniref:Hydrolase TatD n=1 Tax=Paenibacillus naphthalenovorans TaxID=162209 RepID=A0A0U2UP08_9BACL|nr:MULTISPECIES: TatD family hydrolase [Paenibacillus]ALS24780.1 hydrolase TatD [Paenibacillus naphthalenovorans]NTZ19669.1 TatD family deoxyribonuclease [Paenibacillus sp. JMULE4]GCL74572.1 TatD family deoxyribonuclease [Paenibacillus naphthalenovorans]SDJ66099.1 TatD DNase family protein [Paenibacillus naphthalenovorans]